MRRDIDVLEAVRAAGDHRQDRLLGLGEAAVRLRRPLHRRARAIALGQLQIVAHADLVAVAYDRRARQGQHQTVGELEAAAVAVQHRRQPPPDAAVVELHVGIGPEGGEHGLALLVGEATEIELIVIAQEYAPLRRGRARPRRLQRLFQRPAVGGGERVEQRLIDLEVEHHLQAIAGIAEILHVRVRQHIGLGKNDGLAVAPLQELAERAQHVVLLDGPRDVRPLGGDDEGNRVHAEAGDAELDPEAHDLQDLSLDLGIGGVEIRLEIVEAMEVPGPGIGIVRPGRFLHAGKNHALVGIGRLLLGPDVPVAVFRSRVAPRVLEPGVLVRGVVHHEIDEHAHAALLRRLGELDEIAERAVTRVDAVVVRNVIAVVAEGRRLERHEPDRRDAEPAEIVEPARQAWKVADAVAVGVQNVATDRQ